MSDWQVRKVVILMRHGVRAPNQTMQQLSSWSKRKWPVWSVPPGYLTERGRELLLTLWRRLAQEEPYRNILFDKNGCVREGDIYVHADVDERTQSSAAALLDAISPQKKLGYYVLEGSERDPLYHPIQGDVCRASREKDEAEIVELVETTFSVLAEKYSEQLYFVNNLLGPIPDDTCRTYGVDSSCQLRDLTPRVNFSNSGRTVSLRGALGIKATLIQNWLLEYAEWPDRLPGWGQITPEILSGLLIARADIFNCINRENRYARDRGSAILLKMMQAIMDAGEEVGSSARFVVYVGHDTNIAHISQILGLNWNLKGFAYNDIPPAGYLQFTVWERTLREQKVTADFISQPIFVFRSREPDRVCPYVSVIPLEFCKKIHGKRVFAISLENFERSVLQCINSECLPVHNGSRSLVRCTGFTS